MTARTDAIERAAWAVVENTPEARLKYLGSRTANGFSALRTALALPSEPPPSKEPFAPFCPHGYSYQRSKPCKCQLPEPAAGTTFGITDAVLCPCGKEWLNEGQTCSAPAAENPWSPGSPTDVTCSEPDAGTDNSDFGNQYLKAIGTGCATCAGTGVVLTGSYPEMGFPTPARKPCPVCGGTGKAPAAGRGCGHQGSNVVNRVDGRKVCESCGAEWRDGKWVMP